MNKLEYVSAEIAIVSFNNEDILTTSPVGGGDNYLEPDLG